MNVRPLIASAAALTVAASLAAIPAVADTRTSDLTVPAVADLPDDFPLGVDVSSVLSLEESGVVFRNTDGTPADLFDVLAEHGVTDVRVRVWNDPFDTNGNGYGGGNVGVERALEIGARADAAGLGVLVNFHYSDFWADPGKQQTPKAWEGFSVHETASAVYDFTADTLVRFVDADIDVRMVQVGNETNSAVAGHSGWNAMAAIFSAGSAAVRDTAPEAQVALHFTNPERAGQYASFAAELDTRGVDYDVFASSYYPFWHGSTENLTEVLSHVATTYDKNVAVVETSWAYTLDDGDGHENTIVREEQAAAYPVSPQGQATAFRDVVQAVADVGPAGVGVYYWEPAWLPVGAPTDVENNRILWERDGSGWASSWASEYDPHDAGVWHGGSAVDNQALFAFDGTPLPSLRIFDLVRTGEGEDPTDDDEREPSWLPGGGFEGDGAAQWTLEGTGGSIGWHADAFEGENALHVWHDADFTGSLSQTVSGLAAGEYVAIATSQGGDTGSEDTVVLTATATPTHLPPQASPRAHLAQTRSAETPLAFDGWRAYRTAETGPLRVTHRQDVTVTISWDLSAGAWGTIDDVRLIRLP
ncbi:arabinogalactan endo-1,4-beta-galactosidase [Microbacterium amylolyticum]|uniref:Arabinogalactan endo-beta-1,4-galactanase n=1 Tax=Microbacterium amylolyticum TaxID=936337 RepID=A0ABS4ZK43_9MICO|nr:glycosyl hydrolase 53 family protein [Microbacterium amylolyticum]MBP2437659.1 arabinogalactan endo-1,4-beta-galactosidase [Microbacterium amylolyticum]